MSEELKPCPFCGNNVHQEYVKGIHVTESGTFITCDSCNRCYVRATGNGIEVWNTRPIEDKLREIIRRLTADAEMLSIAMNWDEDEDGSEIVSCPHCLNYGVGKNRGKAVLDFGKHLDDCPVALHRKLMDECDLPQA